MQTAFEFTQATDLRSIQKRLAVYFGKIPLEARPDPVSQLVGSILGSRTYDRVSWNAFVQLFGRYRSWYVVAEAPEADIEAIICDVNFSQRKAQDLKQALWRIRTWVGEIKLDFLADWRTGEALLWLERIHGVGRKISAATLNFSYLRGRAFVVDTHVLRVLRRFGFVGVNAATETVYNAMMAAADDFDADGLYELHWYLKSLGQKTCLHARAYCFACPLSDICLQRMEKGANIETQVSICIA